jgi:hypothetical protein
MEPDRPYQCTQLNALLVLFGIMRVPNFHAEANSPYVRLKEFEPRWICIVEVLSGKS